MPSIRIGFSTDFNLTSEQVGIGTTLPSARLDVAGQILSDNSSGSGGLSTITRYDGFLDSEQRLSDNVSIGQTSKGNLNSLSGEIVIENEITVIDGTPLTGGRLDSLTVTGKFDLPHGGTEDREDTPEKGSTRFNQDLGQLEFYTGTEWRTVGSYDGSGRGRGVIAGGVNGAGAAGVYSDIEYLNIQSLGNTQSFGDLTVNKYSGASMSSSTRGVFAGGWAAPVNSYDIEYITIASGGNAIDWTQNNTGGWGAMGASSSTRGLSAGGDYPTATTTIDSIQFSTIGSKEDWGDITALRGRGTAGCNSPTRAIFFGGYATPVQTSNIEFKQTASNSNTVFFGDLLNLTSLTGGGGNSVRGIICGGLQRTPATYHKIIQYVTIATTGNAQYFGDLSDTKSGSFSVSDQIRNVNFGGYNGSSYTNTIEYITIATAGNTQDFGDLSISGYEQMGISDSHGGLGGF
jgi:hypothetical protein